MKQVSPQDAPVALVTGAARRIGAALAEALHGRGYRVLIHYRNNGDAAGALCERLNAVRADSARSLGAALEQAGEARRIAAEAEAAWGGIDVLVNNASSFYPTPLAEATEADWDLLMGSNLKAPLFLAQGLLGTLRQRHGCIVNLVDIHAEVPLADHPIYCAAKAGLAMLTRSLARDLGPEIRVNGIAPGAILWPEQPGAFTDHEQSLLGSIPAQRMGDPQDIVRTALFLIEDAPYITGQIIAVDGGRSVYR